MILMLVDLVHDGSRLFTTGNANRESRLLLKRLQGSLQILHREVVRDHAIALVRERYADFGPTFAAEKPAEHHDLKVSRETLRSWMRQAGIWMSRAERKRIQQPRHRREHIGELVQIDGSEHRWFEDRAAACTLLVFVDDATSRLMELRFVASESTFA
jgi:hypothetical protein